MRLRSVLGATAAVLAAAAIGVGGGYAAGRMNKPDAPPAPEPAALQSAAPLPAFPELDIAKSAEYHRDSDYPVLGVNLTYVPHRAHGAGHVWSYRAPQGWVQTGANPGEDEGTVRWRPAGETVEDHGYLLRILPVAGRDTIEDKVAIQTANMKKLYQDVTVIRPPSDPDSVWYSYRSDDNYHRLNYFAWVTAPGTSFAGFELSVAGRLSDKDGLADLLEKVKASVRPVR